MDSDGGCLTQAPEEAIVTAAELDAAVQAALDAKTGAPSDEAIEAYLQGPEGQALLDAKIDAKIAAYLASQDYLTTTQLDAGLDSCVLDDELPVTLAEYVPQADFVEATTETETRLADLETDAASSVLLADTDIAVADCTELIDELAALQTVRFASGITVTLTVAPGIHNCTEHVEVSHPQGGQIYIVGDAADPTNVELRFDGSIDPEGIAVRDGLALGLVDGFRLVADPPNFGRAIGARSNGTITVGPNMIIEDFAVGEDTYDGAVILNSGDATNHVVITGAYIGLEAKRGSFIMADYIEIQATYLAAHASGGGAIWMDSAVVDSETYGVEAAYGGYIYGGGATCSSSGHCVYAFSAGHISWPSGSATSAGGGQDLHTFRGGVIDATGATGTVAPNVPITDIFELPSAVYQ